MDNVNVHGKIAFIQDKQMNKTACNKEYTIQN